MATIKAKVKKAEIREDGQVAISVELKDAKGRAWTKTYEYYTTQVIGVDSFKKRISEDLKKDLKIADQLKEVRTLIGKEFSLTL